MGSSRHNQTLEPYPENPKADTMASDMRWRVAVIIFGASDEEKAPATYGRHVATSVRRLRISIGAHEGRKGKRAADDSARKTL
jgi:hypothetical protein